MDKTTKATFNLKSLCEQVENLLHDLDTVELESQRQLKQKSKQKNIETVWRKDVLTKIKAQLVDLS